MAAINIDEDPDFALLSNFSENHFLIDGIECYSMEGFLQSLKFNDPEKQWIVCKMVGKQAKFKGKKKKWWMNQKLYWLGEEVDRHSLEYQHLLDKAFGSLAENKEFLNALMRTGNQIIMHPSGKDDPFRTVLTNEEFISRLHRIRREICASNNIVK
jgi:predicted NAD-dependent protein-ADP-ribosyltransferase YbiA (DUF1768 family)